jgi:rhodanese-related sulfurtransferase
MIIYWAIIIIGLALVDTTRTAHAVPPPDFIFAIGSQIAQIFSLLVLGLSVVAGVLRRFFQAHPWYIRHRRAIWIVAAIVVLLVSLLGAYYYDRYRQAKEYGTWVEQSKQQEAASVQDQGETGDNLDQLKLGETSGTAISPERLASDRGLAFIKQYYDNLGSGNIAAAYAVSSKPASFAVYQSWYKNTTGISLDNAQKISDTTYSLGLTLYEGQASTRYAVLMRLQPAGNGFVINHSDVRVLAQAGAVQPLAQTTGSSAFYEQHRNDDLKISNSEFRQVTQQPVFVLDAREDEEYDIGRFPGSHHIRFADLKAGEWITLPQDQVVYVLCWSGIRGKEVAEFLRTKNIVSRYLENGADGWVDFGGKWEGGIKFLSRYSAERYQIVFSTADVKAKQQQGVVLVDSRPPAKYQKKHIPGSVNIPTIYTASSDIDRVFSQVPAGSTVITVCDDFVSCFDAKVTGVKLEKRGATFLGRYNKPWEY